MVGKNPRMWNNGPTFERAWNNGPTFPRGVGVRPPQRERNKRPSFHACVLTHEPHTKLPLLPKSAWSMRMMRIGVAYDWASSVVVVVAAAAAV